METPKLDCDMYAQSSQKLWEHYTKFGCQAYPKDSPFLKISKKQTKGSTRKILKVPTKGTFVVLNRTDYSNPTVEHSNPHTAWYAARQLKIRFPLCEFVVYRVRRTDVFEPLNGETLPSRYLEVDTSYFVPARKKDMTTYIVVKHAQNWENWFESDPSNGAMQSHSAAYTFTGKEAGCQVSYDRKEDAEEMATKLNLENPCGYYAVCINLGDESNERNSAESAGSL